MAHAAHQMVGGAHATEYATATFAILAHRPALPDSSLCDSPLAILGIFGGGAAALHGPRARLLHGRLFWV